MTSLLLFRTVAILEGISFLLLLGFAMPLKYIYHRPLAVEIIGMAHGILFVLFCLLLAVVILGYRMPWKVGAIGFVASLLPFGTFVFDRYIVRRVEQSPVESVTNSPV